MTGRVEQFALRVGDIVNPFMRPAGVLIPEGAGRQRLQAGFGQIEAQIMKVGMIAEATCVSKPWTVIPMVVTGVQDFIAAGQFRGGEQLVDPQQVTRPGTILVFLEPLYAGAHDLVIRPIVRLPVVLAFLDPEVRPALRIVPLGDRRHVVALRLHGDADALRLPLRHVHVEKRPRRQRPAPAAPRRARRPRAPRG